jgi:hypothetical protein
MSCAAIGALLPSSARADVLFNCGHEIHTSYNEGWVVIDYMSGSEGRDDIWVQGTFRAPNDYHIANHQRVWEAIRDRTNWGYNESFIYIEGYTDGPNPCFVLLH